MASQKIYIFALAAQGEGISGSDRIFIEFARNWSKNNKVEITVFQDGYRMCLEQGLNAAGIKYRVLPLKKWMISFVLQYITRIFLGIKMGVTLNLETNSSVIVYSASEFWMDSLPAFILKLRYPNIKWVAAWYQTAPTPFKGFTEDQNSRYRINSFFYYLVQLPVKPLFKKFADFILVNNKNEKKIFPEHNKRRKVIIVHGAIDLEKIKRWRIRYKSLPKIYDAVFQGRFHPQKGVLELIDIWKQVADKKPGAKLIMIGDGPLMRRVKLRIKELKQEDNIKLTGFLFDGDTKYKIFSQSKIVVHPSFYDSGGIAALEAMAFGLPCIGFNLMAYRHYYPKGMLKVDRGRLSIFADRIRQLLTDKKLYLKFKNETAGLISNKFSWHYRSRQILDQVLK
jgi:glycosyltransferase involved in cell wall biosynthesis